MIISTLISYQAQWNQKAFKIRFGEMSVLAQDKIMTREFEMCQPTKHPSFNNVRLKNPEMN